MDGKDWDIFCHVVDNFGDIGVCWRLARQLAAEHGRHVRLWVDDLASFRRLCPDVDPSRETQMQSGVTVRRWATPFAFDHDDDNDRADAADVVIETFACELPPRYLDAMAARAERASPPAWINLEYLSAENWIADCHRMASPHPRLPLRKHFFFPGFTERSGGLLREADLLTSHQAWRADPAAGRRRLGLPPADPGEILVSLFCYGNPALPALLNAWSDGQTPIRCLVPEGTALRQAATALGEAALPPGACLRRGRLALHALPFSSQPDYDRLLSLCDLNFVRGEDSFVRAQWAARPLVWQIYPQEEDAHRIKLAAFLDLYCAGLPPDAAGACRDFWEAWNGGAPTAAAACWPAFLARRNPLGAHAVQWADRLSRQVDLATNLVHFCESLI